MGRVNIIMRPLSFSLTVTNVCGDVLVKDEDETVHHLPRSVVTNLVAGHLLSISRCHQLSQPVSFDKTVIISAGQHFQNIFKVTIISESYI